ncbi:MAG: hypothetical protein HYX29_06085 [Solirubrobacterales bacterium]|nr:hypothetical protein [Solirubrobacterales bacterium]
MSKSSRWALALIGVVIVIVGAILIGTGGDNRDAIQEPSTEATAGTGAAKSDPGASPSGSTGSDEGGGSGSGTGDGTGSGGASPSDPGEDSGGASPGKTDDSGGGADAQIDVVSPVLTASKVQTINVVRGESVAILAKASSTGELHVHGYDKETSLKPDEVVRAKFKATIDGEFPIEFHLPAGDQAEVGILLVSP